MLNSAVHVHLMPLKWKHVTVSAENCVDYYGENATNITNPNATSPVIEFWEWVDFIFHFPPAYMYRITSLHGLYTEIFTICWIKCFYLDEKCSLGHVFLWSAILLKNWDTDSSKLCHWPPPSLTSPPIISQPFSYFCVSRLWWASCLPVRAMSVAADYGLLVRRFDHISCTTASSFVHMTRSDLFWCQVTKAFKNQYVKNIFGWLSLKQKKTEFHNNYDI